MTFFEQVYAMIPRLPRSRAALAAAAALLCASACEPPPSQWGPYAEIVSEEDARGARGLDRVFAHLESDDPDVRRFAVRALGRLEDPVHLDRIAAMLDDPDDAVREAAATAVAQAVFREGAGAAEALAARVEREDDPYVLGSVAANLGRLRAPAEAERTVVEGALAGLAARLPVLEDDIGLAARLGLARGVEALARATPERPLAPPLLEAVDALRGLHVRQHTLTAARIRRLATTAVAREAGRWAVSGDAAGAAGGPSGGGEPEAALRRHEAVIAAFRDGGFRAALGDEDWGVRRAVAMEAANSGLGGPEAVLATTQDDDPRVRLEGLRAYDRRLRPAEGCSEILQRIADADPRVAAVAIDLAARPCPEAAQQEEALGALAARLVHADGSEPGDWQLPARALASLASVAPQAAAPAIASNRDHPSPFARAWVARAAARSGDAETLAALSADPDPNVREAALRGLGAVSGALASFARALGADDAQLVMTAVSLLAEHGALDAQPSSDSPGPPPSPPPSASGEPQPAPAALRAALLEALARFTALERETLRDARMALLGGLERLGGYADADAEPYLADFDPVVADRAADLIAALGVPRPSPQPQPLPLAPPPSAERLAELARSAVRLRMEGLGDIVVLLRPDLAATNADRFARLAESGYFDGLTFHRVVPNFVIQGGSPHANEYAGDGPYSRDEISGRPHWRGAVGLSTRGRDTGDAQIFVNLADNLRLDFNYTILGEVVEGMDVVDRVQEGAVIAEARLERW